MAEKLILENGTWILVTEDANGNTRKVPGTFTPSTLRNKEDAEHVEIANNDTTD